MKKLKLKALELGAKEVLTRNQLKNVLGGDGSGSGSGSTGIQGCKLDTTSCSLYVESLQRTVYGHCSGTATPGVGVSCWCSASYNGVNYQTNNGGTECVYA